MSGSITQQDIIKWTEVIYNPDEAVIEDINLNWKQYREKFVFEFAEYLYIDIQRTKHLFTSPFTFKKEFGKLSDNERSVWFNFALNVPGKLKSLNLFIRPYNDFCRTCLIPYNDLETMAQVDYNCYCRGWETDKSLTHRQNEESDSSPVSFQDLPEKRKRFYIELNHLMPVELKKTGYEIIRPEEAAATSEKIVRKLARAIHSRYLQEMRKQNSQQKKSLFPFGFFNPGGSENQDLSDFDDLPEDIKYSNLDNAFHIPTKLLSAGYRIRHVEKGFKPVALHLDTEEIETMARVEHIRWCWNKILNGWIYGKVKDERKKTHPSIIPYEELSESEREKDRELVRLIPALLHDIDFEVCPVNPDHIKKLSYAIKPHSSVHRLLDKTREMNAEISELAKSSPEIKEKVNIINRQIEETIGEVQGNYIYAQHIQKAFLPDELYIRECLPDNFVLFRPKDIVSGDYYFFSKRDHKIIFAVADCTGHGIPGALLSTIGYGILDQAVNELKMTDPPGILDHLYSRLHRFLRYDKESTGMSDDMDIAVCSLDIRSNKLIFSGVGIPLYRVSGKNLTEYKAGNSAESCTENDRNQFESETITLINGDIIYLCSDGYADQFGGRDHKKYQSSRLKSFLMDIQEYSMPEQSDRLFAEIEEWREGNYEEQTDDILVIGTRI
jgi:serine phosphatase RsbU (regulator of sigma subunit)